MTFSTDLFFKDFWKSELTISLIFALVAGYQIQMEADSGQVIYDQLFLSVVTAIISYLLAFLCARLLLSRLISLPSWVWIGIGGSAVFSFARNVIVYSIQNRRYPGSELTVSSDQLVAFLLLTIIFSFLLLWPIFITRILIVCFHQFTPAKN